MRLRKQLLIVSLFLLVLPISGFLYIREMEMVLRLGQERAALATAQAIADRITSDSDLLSSFHQMQESDKQEAGNQENGKQNSASSLVNTNNDVGASRSIYVHTITSDINLDGYEDEWLGLDIDNLSLNSSKLNLKAASAFNYVYLFASFSLNSPVQYHNPTTNFPAGGDYLLLSTGTQGKNNYVIRTSSPGRIQAVYKEGDKIFQEFQIRGFWREANNGFQIELQIPKSLVKNTLGVAFFQNQANPTLGNMNVEFIEAQFVVKEAPNTKSINQVLDQTVQSFIHENNRLYLLDSQGWILSKRDSLTANESTDYEGRTRPSDSERALALEWLLRLIVSTRDFPQYNHRLHQKGFLSADEITRAVGSNSPVAQWYSLDVDSNLVRVVVPVVMQDQQVVGSVVLEQSNDQWWKYTNSAVFQLILYTFVALLLAAAVILLYASWLSFRIRQLNNYVKKSIHTDGTINRSFPKSNFDDEIGDLNRSYLDLLSNIDEYNDYLRTLSSKLSHELRTPIAVIRSSLDNLEFLNADESQSTYIKRAQEGTSRLSNILTSMNSAKQVEEAIKNTEFENFSLTNLINDIGQAYQPLANERGRNLTVKNSTSINNYIGAPELIVQLLDKLFENALDFCPNEKYIELALYERPECYELVLSNDGPLLPEHMRGQIFDSLISVRSQSSNLNADSFVKSEQKLHLGLGLFIARLVVELHKGSIAANNRKDLSGVEFKIYLPKKPH